jgi:starch-binding outer membrane protein SusE/F
MELSITKSILTGAFLLLLGACKREMTQVTYQGGTAPVLTASATDSITLSPADSSNTAVTFNWTNPNYMFSNGINTFNVSYNLEVDSAGDNFTGPNKQTVSIVSDLSTSFTVTAFNALVANGLALSYGSPHNIQARIVSFLANGDTGAISLYSNPLTFTVTPYAPPPKIAPPPTGELFIVGSATAQGWLSGTTTQQLAVVPGTDGTEFTITMPLTGSGEYKFIGNNNSYNYQYSVATQDTEPTGGPFVANGNNCIAPATSGTYIILVNFQSATFTVTLQ